MMESHTFNSVSKAAVDFPQDSANKPGLRTIPHVYQRLGDWLLRIKLTILQITVCFRRFNLIM